MIRPSVAVMMLSALACTGEIGVPGRPPVDPKKPVDPHVEPSCTTPAVYAALSASCASCHGPGSNRPYFSSGASFQALIVAKPEWIVPGQPDQGRFLPLLRGEAQGSYKQMPPGTPDAAFAALAAQGKTQVSMETLRCWIAALPPNPTPVVAGPLPVARRLSAEQMLAALEQQLGVSGAQFGDTLGMSLPDAIPNTDVYGRRDGNFAALGGPHWLDNRRRNDSVSAIFVQTFVNISQQYCRAAVAAPATSNRLLTAATLADTSAAAAPKIEANIRHLGRLLLSAELTADDVADYLQLFKSFEPDRATAWTAICAAMIRDPLWVTY